MPTASKNNIVLSIVIPIFNSAEKAKTIISAVLSQSFEDFELILVNDGSTDNSQEILKTLQNQDSRIKIINQKNSGASGARNTGLKSASGQYLIFLDSDDDIDSAMIQKMVKKITTTKNLDLVTCGIRYVTIRDRKIVSAVNIGVSKPPKPTKTESLPSYVTRLLGIDGRLYSPCNKIFRTAIIKQNHLRYEEGLDFGEDLTFNLHYLRHCQNIDFILEPLYIYNLDVSSGIFGKSSLIYANRQKNFKQLQNFVSDDLDSETVDLLGWIKFYWFISFGLSVADSSLGFTQKLQKLRQAEKAEKLPLAKKVSHIGIKKFLIEIAVSVFKTSALTLYFFVSALNWIKTNRLLAKTWRKLQVGNAANGTY